MTKHLYNSANLARVARNTDVHRVLGKLIVDLTKHYLAANFLIDGRLAMESFPEGIVLFEALLEHLGREVVVNVSLAATAIAGPADALSEEFLEFGDEGVLLWQIQALEGELGDREASIQRPGVVFPRKGNLLLADFLCPKGISSLSLLDSSGCEMGVCPGYCDIAIELASMSLKR
jgi:hypothetical protein